MFEEGAKRSCRGARHSGSSLSVQHLTVLIQSVMRFPEAAPVNGDCDRYPLSKVMRVQACEMQGNGHASYILCMLRPHGRCICVAGIHNVGCIVPKSLCRRRRSSLPAPRLSPGMSAMGNPVTSSPTAGSVLEPAFGLGRGLHLLSCCIAAVGPVSLGYHCVLVPLINQDSLVVILDAAASSDWSLEEQ